MNYFLCCLAFFFCSVNSNAQHNDSLLAKVITNIRSYHVLNPYERTFTTTDKQFYQPSETVWFKTLLTLNEQPSKLSHVIYTDVTNAKGKLLMKHMWRAEHGTANGSFYLPDSLTTGMYRLRSYSLWMLNEPGSIHEVYFFILGKNDQAKSFVVSNSETVVQVFPEGGTLVAGLPNRVAFSAYCKDGLPVTELSSVELVDAAGAKIAMLPFFYRGIGYFEFVPAQNTNYKLVVKDKAGLQKSVELPVVFTNAISLKLSNLSPSKVLIETIVDDLFITNNKSVMVLAQQNGQIVFANRFQLDEDQKAAIIQKKNLSNGLLQVTIFNEQMQPLSERFIIVTKQSDASVYIDNINFSSAPKTINSFDLNFKGIDTPNLSISIIPFDLPAPSFVLANNIQSTTLNTFNQQKEKRIVPAYKEVADSLQNTFADAVILTMQPHRFTWPEIISGKQPAIHYFFETGISVRGYVKKDKENMQYDSSKVELITKGEDSTTILSYAKPDSRGAFAVNDLGFMKRATVFIQAITKEKKKRQVNFELLPSYIDTLEKLYFSFALNPTLTATTTNFQSQDLFVKNYSTSKLGTELSEIVVKGKKVTKEDSLSQIYSTELFRNSEYTIIPDEKFAYASVWQMLQEYIPGLYVSSATANEPSVSFSRYTLSNDRVSNGDGSANSTSAVPIAFFLNEIPIDIFEVSMINPRDISLIKANRMPNVMIGSFANAAGAEGSIMIYTKKNLGAKFKFDAHQLTGYSLVGNYFSPDYSKPEPQKIEDRRTTLLWQPTIKFDNNGIAKIQFYNNDYTKKFKVVIQGIDKNGNLFYLEKIIE